METNIANGVDDKAERSLVKIANAVKVIGVVLWIIWALIGLIGGASSAQNLWGDFSVGIFITGFLGGVFIGFICWLGCYLAWAKLKVFANISRTLHKIEVKLK